MNTGWFFWIRATYYDPQHDPPCQRQAFSGWWPTESQAMSWANQRYACLPGATYEVVKSRSRDRNVARNEKRHSMVEDGEGTVPDVLNVRFRDQHKKGDEEA